MHDNAFAPSGRTSSLHHTQGNALGYVLVAPSGRALNACAYSLIQLAQVELGKKKDLRQILTAKPHKVESFSFCCTPATSSALFSTFPVLAIEASAQKMGISPSEMRRRLDKVGLIKSLIQDCYETLHTESREAVANDVVEALKNWERE